jgi:uncharacterized membrane protein
MTVVKSSRSLFFLLIVSLCFNVFFVGFMSHTAHAVAEAFIDPQQIIRSRVEHMISGLPDKYKDSVQKRYEEFNAKYNPLISEAKAARKAFLKLLLASPVDPKQATAQAEKLRDITAKLQQGMQETIIDIATLLPEDEKAKIVDNSRVLKVLTQ